MHQLHCPEDQPLCGLLITVLWKWKCLGNLNTFKIDSALFPNTNSIQAMGGLHLAPEVQFLHCWSNPCEHRGNNVRIYLIPCHGTSWCYGYSLILLDCRLIYGICGNIITFSPKAKEWLLCTIIILSSESTQWCIIYNNITHFKEKGRRDILQQNYHAVNGKGYWLFFFLKWRGVSVSKTSFFPLLMSSGGSLAMTNVN